MKNEGYSPVESTGQSVPPQSGSAVDYSQFNAKHDAFDYLKLKQEVLAAATDAVFKVWRSQRGIESIEKLTETYLKIRATMTASIVIE